MPARIGIGVSVALVLGLAAMWAVRSEGAPKEERARTGNAPVVVELFSSEGCSSCPPADAYLRALDVSQSVDGVNVIALEFHVDYWDDIGWKDPFSSHDFTERQLAYAHALRDHHVYTPELVVQGSFTLAPNDGDAPAALQRAARSDFARVRVSENAADVHVQVSSAPPSDARREVWLAVVESGLGSRVTSGENRGRTLEHAPVVRRLSRLGMLSDGAFDGHAAAALDPRWNTAHIRFVALVQERASRRIVGAGVGVATP